FSDKIFIFDVLIINIWMKINRIYLYISLLIAIIITSCDDSSQVSKNSSPQIIGLSRQSTYYNDIITVYGKYFGDLSPNSYLLFLKINSTDTILKLSSLDCINWTSTKITFKINQNMQSCNLSVLVNGIASNKIRIQIEKLPQLEMIEINPDTFLMGSEFGFQDEKPPHQVKLTNKFYISKYEVSQLLWENVMGYNNSIIKSPNLPVHNINWYEAILFCNQISKRMNLDTCYVLINDTLVLYDTLANGYRLLTEAEWEYACKSGSTDDYYGYKPEQIAWFNLNSGYSPHPCGTLTANKYGLYDMLGNIWEWCWDYYSKTYYKDSPLINPIGPDNGSQRVLRGGSCSSGTAYIRASNRMYPDGNFNFCGMRLARTKYE
ncbi:hypothetical protein D9V86_01810, partial [Bacteroidetes/Chlorobi group bacterium ChocPot_Mid]